jgi:hypothetical protein
MLKVSRNSKETLLPPAWKSTDLILAADSLLRINALDLLQSVHRRH